MTKVEPSEKLERSLRARSGGIPRPCGHFSAFRVLYDVCRISTWRRRVFATPKSIVCIVKSGASPELDVLNRFNQLYARQQTTAVNWIEARSSGFTRPNRAKLSACISGSWHNALPPFWWLPCPTRLIADMDHGNLGRS